MKIPRLHSPFDRMSRFHRIPLALLLTGIGLCSATAADWPKFLGPNGNGHSPETGLLKAWPADGPPLLWEREIGTGYSAPSVQGNRLVLHHRQGNAEIVECLDATTGATVWTHSYPSHFVDPYGYNNGPRSSPLLTEDRCYTFGAEGRLVCLSLPEGEVVWSRDTAADFDVPQAFFGVGSSPVLDHGLLMVMVGGQPNSGMVAFDPSTGATRWQSVGRENWNGALMVGWPGTRRVVWRDWEKQASYATPVPAMVNGESHLFCLMRQGLVSLNPTDGEVNFSFWFRARVNESVNAANPIVVENRVFISAAYYGIGSVLLEVDSAGSSVRELWRNTVLEIHWSTPIFADGFLYAFSGRNEPDARFRCVQFDTGKLMWDRDESWRRYSDGPERYGRGSCILADEKLIVLGETGLLGLFKVDPHQPVELARFKVPQLQYPCWTGPVLSDGRLYLRSENRLMAYDFRGED